MQYTLKELRARNDLTQSDMANKLGISRQRYIEIERNPIKASLERMLNVANILGVEIADIFLPGYIANSNASHNHDVT